MINYPFFRRLRSSSSHSSLWPSSSSSSSSSSGLWESSFAERSPLLHLLLVRRAEAKNKTSITAWKQFTFPKKKTTDLLFSKCRLRRCDLRLAPAPSGHRTGLWTTDLAPHKKFFFSLPPSLSLSLAFRPPPPLSPYTQGRVATAPVDGARFQGGRGGKKSRKDPMLV